MSEPLLGYDEEDEGYYGQGVINGRYVDVFASANVPNRPLSNGSFFLVLSLSDWERERLALVRMGEQKPYYVPDDEPDIVEDDEGLVNTVQHLVGKVLCCFKLST